MTLSESIEVAAAIVRCYPNGGKDAGDGYIGALAAVLGSYPRSISLRAADPVRGIPSENRFLPTPADMIAWFERQMRPLVQQYECEERVAKQLEDRRAFTEFERNVRPSRLTLHELKEKYGDWNDSWRPLGERAAQAQQQAREMLIEQIGEEAFNALPEA